MKAGDRRADHLLMLLDFVQVLIEWLEGLPITGGADETSRRAVVARDALARDGATPGERMTRVAAATLLALPEEHSQRDVDLAAEALWSHLDQLPDDDTLGCLETLGTLLRHGLVDDSALSELADSAFALLGRPLPEDASEAGYLAACQTIVRLALLEAAAACHERASRTGRFWEGRSAREVADRASREVLDVSEPLAARVVRLRNALFEGSAAAAGFPYQWLHGGDALERLGRPDDAQVIYDALVLACGREEQAHTIAHARSARLRMNANDLADVVDRLQDRYVTAVPERDIADAGTEFMAATDALTAAYARSGDWSAAVATADRAKSLRGRYRAAVSTGDAAENLLALERQLHAASRGVIDDQAVEENPRGDALARFVPADQRLLEEYRRARPWLGADVLESADVQQLSGSLRDGEAAIVLAVTPLGTLLALVLPGGVSDPSEHLFLDAWTAQRWRRLLSGEIREGWLTALAEPDGVREPEALLSYVLQVSGAALDTPLALWLERHEARRVVLVPSKELHLVPLWALPSLASRPVLMAASAAQFVAARSRMPNPATPGRAVTVINPTSDLPLSAIEATGLDAAFGARGWSVTKLQEGATEEQVASALTGINLLHFSGHAQSRPERPSQSGLLMAPADHLGVATDLSNLARRAEYWHRQPDGTRWTDVQGVGRLYERASPSGMTIERWLECGPTSTLWSAGPIGASARVAELWTAGDITVSRSLSGCDLVVLSACASGVSGMPAYADEHGGLAAALQLAGAGTVVATLWPVFEDAAALFIDAFYDALVRSQDGDVAAAVHAGRERLRMITADEAGAYFQARQGPESRPGLGLALEACVAALGTGPDHPYADPQHHAAFFATGSGLIKPVEARNGNA